MARSSAKGAGFIAWSTASQPSSRADCWTWPVWKLLETRHVFMPTARRSPSHARTDAGGRLVSRGTQVLSRSMSTSRTPASRRDWGSMSSTRAPRGAYLFWAFLIAC